MVGIVDYDFITDSHSGIPTPSLVAMKIAAYYKQYVPKEQCKILTDISQMMNCNELYFLSNQLIEDIPDEVFMYDDVKFYGKFLPDDIPELIHHQQPLVSIYNDIVQARLTENKIGTAKALAFLDAIYYQAKVNGKFIPVPAMAPKSKVFLYDKDLLANNDCWEILDKIITKRPSSIKFIEPIQCHTVSQFFYLREEYEKVSRANKIILDYFVPQSHFDKYFGKYKLKLLGEITKNSEISIYLGKNYNVDSYTSTFYVRNIAYCLNLLFSYYSRNIPVMAEIYYPPIKELNSYIEIYKVIRRWANSKDYDLTLEAAFRTKAQRQILENLLEKNPIFKGFLPFSKNKLIQTRGMWRVI